MIRFSTCPGKQFSPRPVSRASHGPPRSYPPRRLAEAEHLGLQLTQAQGRLRLLHERAFQQEKGLAVDGIVGPATWSALIITVRQGSQGDAVRGVQEEFRFRDQSGGPGRGLAVDGIFGPKTATAVRSFQQALGITVDGIVGPLTWRALVSGMLSF